MRFMFSFIIFVVVSSVVCDVNRSVRSISQSLALEVLLTTLNTTRNEVVSVLPLQFSLCKLASVAEGEAKKELLKALGFTNEATINNFYEKLSPSLNRLMSTDLTYVNKIYVNYTDAINHTFLANSSIRYGVHVDKVSYNMPRAAVSFINRGIASITYRRLEDVMQDNDIDDSSSLLLVNAAHMKPTWDKPFEHTFSRIKNFHFLNKTFQVPMMVDIDSFLFYDAKDFQVVTKELMFCKCSISFVLPFFLQLDQVLMKLRAEPNLLQKVRKLSSYRIRKLMVPKIKIRSGYDLTGFLKKIGIKEILSSNSTGLNAILNKGVNASNIFISKVKQRLFLEVDEYGVTRPNRAVLDLLPKPVEAPGASDLVLDRPFYFTINLDLSQTESYEIFSGVYYRPD